MKIPIKADLFPAANAIPYVEWHLEAERRDKAGQKQVKCKSCELWYYPKWKADKAEHDRRCFAVYEWRKRNQPRLSAK